MVEPVIRRQTRAIIVTIVAVSLVTALRALLHRTLGQTVPYITFYPAAVIASLYGGMLPGLLAVILSTTAALFWLGPVPGWHFPRGADVSPLLLFIAIELMIVWLAQRSKREHDLSIASLAERDVSEQRISGMLDSLDEAFVLLDGQWRFIYVNESCDRLFGIHRKTVMGQSLWEIFPDALGTDSEKVFRSAMQERRAISFELQSRRLKRWIAGAAVPVGDGLSIQVRDVDARKQTENALRESEAQYRRLLETALEGIWITDSESRTTYVNRALGDMLGYSSDEMIGRRLLDFMDAASQSTVETTAYPDGLQGGQRDLRFVRKNSTEVHAHVSINPIFGSDGNYHGSLAMVSDITDRREAELDRADLLQREQRARADAETANRRKDQFLAVLSHELRTPLTPVIARLELMKRDPALSATLRNGLEMIRRNVELEARLIDDLLDMTRLARGQIQLQRVALDAFVVLHAALDIYSNEISSRRQAVILELTAENHFMSGDSIRLQQIFWNLISNAVKYTPEGGRITVRARNVVAQDASKQLRIEFVDNGIGIEPEMMARLFDPFEQGEQTLTRRFGGLGLGLSITRSLVGMHGGTITGHSNGLGTGATFVLDLPTVPDPTSLVKVELESKPVGIERTGRVSTQSAVHRILLVDDNQDTLRVIARLLRLNGHEVMTAETLGDALTVADQPYDLLITDIGLPDGTGWDLMKTLRARGPVRGIALSGFSMDEDIRRSRDVGFIEHLCKPIMPDDLERAIERAAKVTA